MYLVYTADDFVYTHLEDQMASIKPRKSKDGTTTWLVRWREGGGTGPERGETFVIQHEAELLRDYLNANGQSYARATDAYTHSRAHGPTLADTATLHIKALTGVEERTKADYQRDVNNHILPHLGHIRAGQITRAHIRAWINKLVDDGAAPKSIANYHGLLSAIMNTAIEQGTRADNPCKGVRLPKRSRRGDREKFLEPEEYQVLLAQFPDRWKPIVQTLAGTGMRWGEVTALTVADLMLNATVPYINIDKAWKRDDHNRFYVDRPKTEMSNREVTIDTALAKILAELSAGREGKEFLFLDDKGKPIMHRVFFRDVWKPATAAAMERRDDNPAPLRVRPQIHGLRHSHASMLLGSGVDLFTVQRRLGHESIQTTADRYGHVMRRSERLAADTIGRVLNPEKDDD